MAATVSNGTRRPEVMTRDLPMLGATPGGQQAVNDVDGWQWLLPILRNALDATMPFKAAAAAMKTDQGQLSRQFTGDGHLSIKRLAVLGDAYWKNVVIGLQIHFGLLDRDELIAEAERLQDRARQLLSQAARR